MMYVVTAVHNRYNITKRFIEQLLEQTYKEFVLVLIDDGSTDNTTEMVKALMPSAVIIRGNGNLYWGGAMHEAYKWLKENAQDNDYVMISNDDVYFDSNYLQTAAGLLDKNKDAMVCGRGFGVHTGARRGIVIWDYKRSTETEIITEEGKTGNRANTSSLFFSVKTMKLTGGFHPILLPHYFSDLEWTMRAAKKGVKIVIFNNLNYKYDENTTGANDLERISLKQLFSKRSERNPIYRLTFLFLATPVKYLPSSMFYQAKRYIKKAPYLINIIKRSFVK